MAETSFEKKTGRDSYFAALEREIQALLDPETGLLSEKFSQRVNCAICSADRPEKLFVKRGYTFVRCLECGHIYTNPQVLGAVVAETYRKSVANDLWIKVLLNKENQAWQIPYFESALDLLETHVEKGSLVDIGCSIGLFAKVAVKRGWNVIGLELNRRAAEYARGKGLDVREQFLEEAGFANASVDAITAFGVLEHLNDPRQLVNSAGALLRPGGVFMAISPNAFSLASMIMREKMPTFDGRNHLQYFTYDSFKRLFEQNSYEVRHLDTVLSALPNIHKCVQYRDPYGESAGLPESLPSHVRKLFSGRGRDQLEALINENHLGLRLRLLAGRAG